MFVAYRQFASAVGTDEIKEVHVRLPGNSEIARDGTVVYPATVWDKNKLLLEKYFADVSGDIWSRKNGSTLTKLSKAGRVALIVGGETRQFLVHRIIASTFLSALRHNGQTEVDHIDIDRENNALSNLRWATKKQNAANKCPVRAKAHRKRVGDLSARPVHQLCPKDGSILEEFPSQRAAAEALGIFQGNISKATSGKLGTTGGFAWRLAPLQITLEDFKNRGFEVVGQLEEAPCVYFSSDLQVYNDNKFGKMYTIPIAHGHTYPNIVIGRSLRYVHVVVAALRGGYKSMAEFDAYLTANDLVVMHDEDADKSNWWNCKLGTRSENALDAVRNGCNVGKSAPRPVEIRLSALASAEIWKYDDVREAKFASYREAARNLSVYSDLKNLASNIGTSARTGGYFSLKNGQKAWAFYM
jgi:hypothetical protein